MIKTWIWEREWVIKLILNFFSIFFSKFLVQNFDFHPEPNKNNKISRESMNYETQGIKNINGKWLHLGRLEGFFHSQNNINVTSQICRSLQKAQQ